MSITLPPEGVVTVCSGCGRPMEDGELYADPCGRPGCEGTLAQHEDLLQLSIRGLQVEAARRVSPDLPVEVIQAAQKEGVDLNNLAALRDWVEIRNHILVDISEKAGLAEDTTTAVVNPSPVAEGN